MADQDQFTLPERIRRTYRLLGDGQRQAAQFILDRPHEAAFLTSARLGELAGVSESTVVRLAMRLGYTGYPEMQQMIQGALRQVALDRQAPPPVEQPRSGGSVYAAMLAVDRVNLHATAAGLSEQDMAAAVDLLLRARHVFVVGARVSHGTAFVAWVLFQQLLRRCTLLTMTAASLRDQVLSISADDAVLLVTVPRYAIETMRVFRHARRVGAAVISITDSLLSPAADQADVALLFHHLTPSFFNSAVGAVAIVNALAAGLAEGMGVDAARLLEELEESYHRWSQEDPDALEP